jgi:uncharacterized protein YciI
MIGSRSRRVILCLCTLGLTGIAPPPARAQIPDTALFAITFTTGPGWDSAKPAGEQRFMSEHSRNLFRLRDAGTIVMGSRFGEFGLIIVRAASDEDARALFRADSAVASGVFLMRVDSWLTLFDGCIPAARSGDDPDSADRPAEAGASSVTSGVRDNDSQARVERPATDREGRPGRSVPGPYRTG